MTDQNLDATGPYIWLRYATQYSKDSQMHTIEVSVPVPLGASTEQREELFREAEAGMNQLVNRLGQTLSQTPQRVQNPQVESRSVSMQKSVPSPQPRSRPAAMPEAQIASQTPDGQGRDVRSTSAPLRDQEPVVPPTRPNVGASMPITLGPNLDSSGSLPLPEFIQYINENLNLTPRQAMEMLKVKSLSTGVNLREALERLRYLVAQRNAHSVTLPEEAGREQEHPPVPRDAPLPSLSRGAETHPQQPLHTLDDQASLEGGDQQKNDLSQIIEMRVSAPIRFDEEEDLEDLHLSPKFTPEQLEDVRSKIDELREFQGATIADPKRLQALTNVIGEQIGQERLQELIVGVWSISILKKLKVDQVEALISWAKQDGFVDEVEAALALLEEDRYARGNR